MISTVPNFYFPKMKLYTEWHTICRTSYSIAIQKLRSTWARLRLGAQQSESLFLSKQFLARTINPPPPHITQIIRYTKKASILGYGAMQSVWQVPRLWRNLQHSSTQWQNWKCMHRFLGNINASHVAVEWLFTVLGSDLSPENGCHCRDTSGFPHTLQKYVENVC